MVNKDFHCVLKKFPDITDYDFKKDYQMLIIFGTYVPDTTGHQTTVEISTSPLLLHYLGKTDASEVCVEINQKTSINLISPDLWAPTAGRLQGLTVMQQ